MLELVGQGHGEIRAPNPAGLRLADWSEARLIIADEAAAASLQDDLLLLKRRAAAAYLPVVVALAPAADSRPWLAAGFDDVLRLPLNRAEVQARLESLLRLQGEVERNTQADALRWRAAVGEAEFGLTLLDADGTLIYRSPSVAQLSGYSDDERVGHNVLELVHPDDRERARAVFGELLRAPGSARTLFYRSRRKNGEWRWLEASLTNLLHQPQLQAVVAHFLDVTDRLRVEEAVRNSRQQLQTIMDSTPTAIAYIREDGRYLFANQVYAGRFGLTPDEVVSRALPDVLGQRAYNRIRERLSLALSGRAVEFVQTVPYQTVGEREMLINYVPDTTEAGSVRGLVIVVNDITERNRAERRIRELVETAPDAIVILNHSGRIVLVNQQTEKNFGYERAELLDQPLELLVPERFRPAHRAHRQGYLAEPKQRPMGAGLELFGRRKDGSEFPVEISLSPFRGDEGLLVTAAIRNISERKQVEAALQAKNDEISAMNQQLWQTAKLATMGELAASVAHELNNPLAIISLRVERLVSLAPPDGPFLATLRTITVEIERMGRLIADLLQFSRRSAPQLTTVDLRQEIENTLEFVNHFLLNRRVEVRQNAAPDTPLIQADRQQLRQLFLNLITNASDAMPDGGRLSIRLAPGSLNGGDAAAVIEFEDTGIGIPAEVLDSVWEPFFTTKPEGRGTGLGLAICRRVVEEHGGVIRLESRAGRGTTVRVALPASPAAPALLKS